MFRRFQSTAGRREWAYFARRIIPSRSRRFHALIILAEAHALMLMRVRDAAAEFNY